MFQQTAKYDLGEGGKKLRSFVPALSKLSVYSGTVTDCLCRNKEYCNIFIST